MLTFTTFTARSGKGMILKVTEDLTVLKCNKKNHIYFMLWIETGYWYKLNVCPNLTEHDDLAISYMEHITETCTTPLVPPVGDWYERAIRDTYLPKVTGDNLQIIEYNGWSIWSGYNDTDERGYYFVCDEEGNDIGTSEATIKDAINAIKEPVTWILHEDSMRDEHNNLVDEYALYNEAGQAVEREFESLDELVEWVTLDGRYRIVDSFVRDC